MYSLTWIEAGKLRAVSTPSLPALRSLYCSMYYHHPVRAWRNNKLLFAGRWPLILG